MQAKPFIAKRARVEMIPLIDMFFLLLVFFIFGVFSMSMQQGIVVDLPSAQTATAQPQEDVTTISVTAAGEILVQRISVAREELPALLRQRQASHPQAMVVINADRAAQHGVVLSVLDAVRQAGIQQVSFQTEPASP